MKVVASIVNWNTVSFLEKCLRSIFEKTKGIDFEVWVFDNGSKDESVKMIKKKFPEAKLIENGKNIGFGKAHNRVFESTCAEYFAAINSDIVFENNVLKSLADFLDKNERAAAASCKLLNANGSVQENISVFPSLARELVARLPFAHNPYHPKTDYSVAQEVETFNGACFIVRKSAVREKLFDGGFFAYAEETDLFFRLEKAGWKNFFEPKAIATHFGGASSTEAAKHAMHLKGLNLFFEKHFGKASAFAFRLIVLVSTTAKLFLSALALDKKQFDYCRGIIKVCIS